jgi:hypothetical protein
LNLKLRAVQQCVILAFRVDKSIPLTHEALAMPATHGNRAPGCSHPCAEGARKPLCTSAKLAVRKAAALFAIGLLERSPHLFQERAQGAINRSVKRVHTTEQRRSVVISESIAMDERAPSIQRRGSEWSATLAVGGLAVLPQDVLQTPPPLLLARSVSAVSMASLLPAIWSASVKLVTALGQH